MARALAIVAVASVVLAAYSPRHLALAAANLCVSVPAMILVKSRPEFLTIAAMQLVLSGLLGPATIATRCVRNPTPAIPPAAATSPDP